MIAVSKGCTTLVADWATILPWEVTTLSIGIRAAAPMQAAAREQTTQTVPRAPYKAGATVSAAVGEWNSSSPGKAMAFALSELRRVN